jgi:nucleotide-binding universal stress UspA family protein
MMGVELDLVLAPVDTSNKSERAVDYAIAVADRYDANLHLLHVLDERIARGIEAGDVTAESVAEEHRSFSDHVAAELDDGVSLSSSSVAGFSAHRLTQTPGSVILDAADELDADFLVIPRETETDGLEATVGKAALHVLEYASQPVLSV